MQAEVALRAAPHATRHDSSWTLSSGLSCAKYINYKYLLLYNNFININIIFKFI